MSRSPMEHFDSLTLTISLMRFDLHFSPQRMKRGRGGRVWSIHIYHLTILQKRVLVPLIPIVLPQKHNSCCSKGNPIPEDKICPPRLYKTKPRYSLCSSHGTYSSNLTNYTSSRIHPHHFRTITRLKIRDLSTTYACDRKGWDMRRMNDWLTDWWC